MERISHKTINELVERVAEVKGFAGYSNRETKSHYLDADYNSVYGGWRLNWIDSKTGGHNNLQGLSSTATRLSTREFYQFLRGLICEL